MVWKKNHMRWCIPEIGVYYNVISIKLQVFKVGYNISLIIANTSHESQVKHGSFSCPRLEPRLTEQLLQIYYRHLDRGKWDGHNNVKTLKIPACENMCHLSFHILNKTSHMTKPEANWARMYNPPGTVGNCKQKCRRT